MGTCLAHPASPVLFFTYSAVCSNSCLFPIPWSQPQQPLPLCTALADWLSLLTHCHLHICPAPHYPVLLFPKLSSYPSCYISQLLSRGYIQPDHPLMDE